MSRQVLAGVVAAVAAFTLSGCGAASPGVAVKVGDQTLSMTEVDELTVGYCDGLEQQFEASGTVLPMSFVRDHIVRNLTVRAAAEQLAEEYSVDLPPTYARSVRDLRGQMAELPEDRIDQVLEVESVGAYVQAVEIEVGDILLAQAGESGADDQAKLARGQDALRQWMSEHPADINPRYGIAVSDPRLDVAPTLVDTGTSYALSANAVDGAKAEPDQAYAATLPSSQRCG
jgi:hypothetical protein